ncbi:MAG TPA: amino acid adenylation domain-containing protein, partial [Symbiobacteriaceae bacterium]|nr:amino acid adenylation domain-containing protein [Symbiobacteriaceae bacterium]
LTDLAYVIYTSGSTGEPKGVEIEHGSLSNLVTWFRRAFALTPADRVTFNSGLGFDASVSEIWPCLSAGACLCLPDEESRLSPEGQRDWLAETGVTVAFAPTPMAEKLIELPWPSDCALRMVYAGGDELRRFPPPGLPFTLMNAYGPTECTCISTCGPVGGGRKPSIGRAVENAVLLVLDAAGQPAAEGELYIGGAVVGRGYRGRPDLTAERFVWLGSERYYRTGDLVRQLPNGELEFLGRLDAQVKIRGFRIELGEIESRLLAHPAVREAAVTVWEDAAGEKRLAAYLAGAGADALALREFLAERLPAYMLPAAFTWLPSLPLTPSGKLDRKALPPPDFTALRPAYAAPETPVERQLAAWFSELLGAGEVGRHDDFFLLGGHSLLATQLLSRVRSTYAAAVSMAEFFAAPTVCGLAGCVDAVAGACTEGIPHAERTQPLPLSFAQERIAFFDELEPGSPLYNIAEAVRLTGPLSADDLEKALNLVVQRHESQRTAFMGGWQVICPDAAVVLVQRDALLDDLEAVIQAEARRPFDLGAAPLMRATLFRLGPEEHLLLLVIHHIITDGWSMGVFYRELSAAYAGRPLPPVPLQYADFACWQRSWLQGAELEAQLAYWRKVLEGVPPVLDLPADRPRPSTQSFVGARRVRPLPPYLLDGLKALARSEGATLFMTLLAAYQALLYRYTGQERFLTGAPVAGRNRAELEPLIGFFVNTLALPADFTGGPSFRQHLARVRQTTLDAFAHQDLPFEKLVEALHPDRDRSRPPLIQTLFALQSAPAAELRLPGISATALIAPDTGTAKYDLILTVEEAGGTYHAVAEYAAALYDPATADRLLGHFETLLGGIVANPDTPVTHLPLLTADELQQILVDWNATDAPYSLDRSPAELVAACPPSAPAVNEMSYGELNRRAGALARRLAELGVRRGDRVGVCLERSPDLPVALLGVWKAGAAYVAMDPAYPDDRLNFMLADSGARVVITRRDLCGQILRVEEVPDREPPPSPAWSPDDLAYVIYTSGSTGQPKGVEIAHRGLLNLIFWHRRTYGVTAADRATQLAGPGFDASVWELWPYLTAGAQILMPDEETRLSPPLLQRWLLENRVSITFLPTPLAEAMLALPWPEHHSLAALLTGGDKLHHFPDRPLGFTLYNHYGPTEATVVATAGPVPLRAGADGAPPIGRPIAGTRAYILDRQHQPVPVGIPGELYIGGVGLAHGYTGRPDLTAERFIQTEWGRLYRTGDLVRWLPDGQIEFLGRLDFQVKLRGFRIELGEIEAALLKAPDVADAVVELKEQRLIAYLIPAPGRRPDSAALKGALAAALPDYMVPAAFVTLDRFPLTPNGKVDRRSLPTPDRATDDREPPATPAEVAVAAIWAEVLGIEPPGLTDDFFALGGHSLAATRVIHRLREQLQIDLPLRALFETPVLRAFAARVAAATAAPAALRSPTTLDPEAAGRW